MDKELKPLWEEAYQSQSITAFSSEPNATLKEFEHLPDGRPHSISYHPLHKDSLFHNTFPRKTTLEYPYPFQGRSLFHL